VGLGRGWGCFLCLFFFLGGGTAVGEACGANTDTLGAVGGGPVARADGTRSRGRRLTSAGPRAGPRRPGRVAKPRRCVRRRGGRKKRQAAAAVAVRPRLRGRARREPTQVEQCFVSSSFREEAYSIPLPRVETGDTIGGLRGRQQGQCALLWHIGRPNVLGTQDDTNESSASRYCVGAQRTYALAQLCDVLIGETCRTPLH